MDALTVKEYYRAADVVEHYALAVNRVGLWRSEELIFQRVFQTDQSILELGSGAGRIAIGLWELGYQRVMGTDFAREMVEEARRLSRALEYAIPFQYEDATELSFGDDTFDGAIFGFNGLMQIPGRVQRQQALREIYRVLVPGSWFVFTTHDRESHGKRSFWKEQQKLWAKGPPAGLSEFGDLSIEAPNGKLHFIHSPTIEVVTEDIAGAGFRLDVHVLRAEIANEPPEVREFADDCRFWVVQKPA
ncbi:MAG: class I SAM-dependent methyltransferase [Opitutales bacterium]